MTEGEGFGPDSGLGKPQWEVIMGANADHLRQASPKAMSKCSSESKCMCKDVKRERERETYIYIYTYVCTYVYTYFGIDRYVFVHIYIYSRYIHKLQREQLRVTSRAWSRER